MKKHDCNKCVWNHIGESEKNVNYNDGKSHCPKICREVLGCDNENVAEDN